MKLDQIEARLQALIEGSAELFANGDMQQRLAHQLVQAAQENLATDQPGNAITPGVFTIFLHPDNFTFWQENNHLLDSICDSLQEAAREYGVFFSTRPIIQLQPDTSLSADELRVKADALRDDSGQTAAFSVAPTVPQTGALPQNAFLIVEGHRTYPLNRMVINIGRRPDNHLVLQDPRVSRTHAQIRAIRGQYVLFDLNSTGGTLVNGRRIHQYILKPGDVISLSGVPLIYGEDPAFDDDPITGGLTRSMGSRSNNSPPEIIE